MDVNGPAEDPNKTHAAVTGGGSAFRSYQDVIVGSRSLGRTLYFEFCAWLAPVPGALGLLLRKWFWPALFAGCGGGVTFGSNVVLRHPGRIRLGDRVVVSEGCVLDGRHDRVAETLVIGDNVMLANQVVLSCKQGTIHIGRDCGIGTMTVIQSTHDCPVRIGDDVIIGPQCYLVGGGSYRMDRTDIPIRRQGIAPDSGVVLEADVWLGARVTVLGGVTMARGSVAAAGAVVNQPVAADTICAGVPARALRKRGGDSAKS
jgi:galactoside O-acetyltransferase